MSLRFAAWRWLLTGIVLWLAIGRVSAQVAPHGYEFMTVIATQTGVSKSSLLQFIPAFQDKTEIQLETISGFSYYCSQDSFKKNTKLINQQLGLATAQGWELVQALPSNSLLEASYLFRKPRP